MTSRPHFRKLFLAGLASVSVSLFLSSRFLIWIETRQSSAWNDWLLERIPSLNCSWPIFLLIYGMILLCLWELWKKPEQFVMGLFAYSLILLFRDLSIYLVPLEPPAGIIPLVDPMVRWALNFNIINKDLFFSGHVSTICLLLLASGNPRTRWVSARSALPTSKTVGLLGRAYTRRTMAGRPG